MFAEGYIGIAGTIGVGPAETMTLADFHDAMAANFWSAVHTTLEILPDMRARAASALPDGWQLDRIVPTAHLPRTSDGKIRKELLRAGAGS